MGCFLGCFGSSKDGKRRKHRKNRVLNHHQDQRHVSQNHLQHTVSAEQAILERPTNLVSESRDKPEDQLSLSARKKVTFDANVKTYEPVAVHESTESLSEIEKVSEKEKGESLAKSSQSHSLTESDSISSSVGSYPPNHRYQNCRDSDDEGDELDNEESDEEEEDDDDDDDDGLENYDYDDEVEDNRVLGGEVWSKSTSTLPARAILEEVDSPMIMSGSLIEQESKPIGFNRNARDRSVYVHPVLNPVENLTQWKAVKSKGTTPLNPDKENSKADHEAPITSFGSEPSFKFKFDKPTKSSNQEIAVDASLSNWLVSSETTPVRKSSFTGFETIRSEKSMSQGSNSARSFEDRPILGALTVEELKQFSVSASPRRSPSRSPDDMAIIGTVGTYWNHAGSVEDSGSASSFKGIPNTTSKYREDKRVNWHSTPFETRLERALNRGSAED